MARERSPQEEPEGPAPTTRPPDPAPRGPVQAVLAMQRTYGNTAVGRWLARATAELEDKVESKDASARFEGDVTLEKIQAGTETLKRGSRGLQVTKLQQALVDAGYPLSTYGVDGKFEGETETALKQFQKDKGKAETGELDADTLSELNKLYDTRQPYLDNATFDPADPNKGTRKLSAGDKAAVKAAMVPPRGAKGGPSTFQDEVAGEKYGDRIRDRLDKLIKGLHKELYADKKPLRADEKKNFHEWSTLESAAKAAADTTDNVYGSYAKANPPTEAGGTLVDQWKDEETRNAGLSDKDKKIKAREKVNYLIASNCRQINTEHAAVPTDAKEKAILDPIVETFVDTPDKVQILLEIETGWEGAELEGVIYLQRFKQQGKDEKEMKAKNRQQLWELFHTCIHEYIHALAAPKYLAYADKLDSVRRNTLIEGMCDFFTENVRKTVAIDDALRKQVEGPYYESKEPVPKVTPSVYPSIAEAERVVGIVGIRNAQAAYFKGDVDKIGGA